MKNRDRNSAAEDRWVDRGRRKAETFNEKWNRIQDNYDAICLKDNAGSVIVKLSRVIKSSEYTVKLVKKFQKVHDEYLAIIKEINDNIEKAGISDLSRLSTAARRSILCFLELTGNESVHDAENKTIEYSGRIYDFR